MRDYERIREIIQYCRAFPDWFFGYLLDSVASDEKVMDVLEEYADWSDQDIKGFSEWSGRAECKG